MTTVIPRRLKNRGSHTADKAITKAHQALVNLGVQSPMPISVESAQRRYFEAVKIGDLIATGAAALAWFWVLDLTKVLSADEGALLLSQGGGVATAIGKGLAWWSSCCRPCGAWLCGTDG